jgi:hypothetical protein
MPAALERAGALRVQRSPQNGCTPWHEGVDIHLASNVRT